jgi:hypothetical protein
MDSRMPPCSPGFKGYQRAAEFEHRFSTEEKLKPYYSGNISRRMLRFINPSSQLNLFPLI